MGATEEEVGATDKMGRTALMWAAQERHADCAHVLLAHTPEEAKVGCLAVKRVWPQFALDPK